MKSLLKILLPIAVCAATPSVYAGTTCGLGATHSDYYKLTAIENGTKISVKLQGYGANKLPNSNLPYVLQSMEMTEDCKFVSIISIKLDPAGSPLDVFTLTGSWSYPAESKVIYFTIDGDVSLSDASTGTWGTLFSKTEVYGVANFIPLLINPLPPATTKVNAPLSIIHPSVLLKTGTIKLSSKGDTAVINTLITGRAVAQSTAKETTKEVSFSFGATTKSTVSTTPPI